jgi:hypothetical protein
MDLERVISAINGMDFWRVDARVADVPGENPGRAQNSEKGADS